MFPRILELEILGRQVGLNTYGLMAAVGYLTAVWLAYRQSKRTGMDADAMLDLCFWVLVSSLLGSRVMYVLANLDLFAKNWVEVFYVWEGGLVYYGGLGAALQPVCGISNYPFSSRVHVMRSVCPSGRRRSSNRVSPKRCAVSTATGTVPTSWPWSLSAMSMSTGWRT